MPSGLQRASVLVLACLALFAAGCETTGAAKGRHREHADLAARVGGIRTVGVMPLDLKVYEISAGGVAELKDDWTESAKGHVRGALETHLGGAGLALRPVETAAGDDEQVRALYEAVSASILAHTYIDPFPHKVSRFDYSLGAVDALLERSGADALLFVSGADRISSGGRKTVAAVTSVVAAAFGVVAVPQGGATTMTLALVDRTGAVLWFSVYGAPGRYDLRDGASASAFVNELLAGFPGRPK